MEECLRIREARAMRMLLLFENAEDAQASPQASQVMLACNHLHLICRKTPSLAVVARLPATIPLAASSMALLMWVQELAKALKLLAGNRTVSVLVTSRSPIACGHAASVGISMLGIAPAVQLLQDRAGPELAHVWEADQAQQLADLCGRNGLYLTILGSLISAKRSTIEVRGGTALFNIHQA